MSVILFTEAELTATGAHILALCQGALGASVFAARAREAKELLGDKATPEEALLFAVSVWLQSVSVANQAAYAATCRGETHALAFYSFPKLSRAVPTNPAAVFGELGSLSYNVISNGGRRWLSQEDEEVLIRLRLHVAYRLVEAAR